MPAPNALEHRQADTAPSTPGPCLESSVVSAALSQFVISFPNWFLICLLHQTTIPVRKQVVWRGCPLCLPGGKHAIIYVDEWWQVPRGSRRGVQGGGQPQNAGQEGRDLPREVGKEAAQPLEVSVAWEWSSVAQM